MNLTQLEQNQSPFAWISLGALLAPRVFLERTNVDLSESTWLNKRIKIWLPTRLDRPRHLTCLLFLSAVTLFYFCYPVTLFVFVFWSSLRGSKCFFLPSLSHWRETNTKTHPCRLLIGDAARWLNLFLFSSFFFLTSWIERSELVETNVQDGRMWSWTWSWICRLDIDGRDATTNVLTLRRSFSWEVFRFQFFHFECSTELKKTQLVV